MTEAAMSTSSIATAAAPTRRDIGLRRRHAAERRFRLYGVVAICIGIGFLAIQGLNLVRIISLFYLGQWNRMWFDWFHLYLWQALIVLDALAVWLIWLRYLPRRVGLRPAAA